MEELGFNLPDEPADDEEEKTYIPTYPFTVKCKTEAEMNKLMAELLERGFTCETE